jgi:hypothetical protein
MKTIVRSWFAVLAAILLVACNSPGDAPAAEARDGTWYTLFTLRYEKDLYRTTNYRRGVLLPINTVVTIRSMGQNRIEAVVGDTGRTLTIENVEKHTAMTLEQAFAQVFGRQPVDLGRYGAAERQAIDQGRVEVGMRRDAVLAAIGPPPAVGTASLQSNEWTYWSSRFTTFRVRFDGDRVVEVID